MSTKVLRIAAVVLFLTASIWWVLSGANLGWTKTSQPLKTLDPVTGLEGITYEKRFIPGVDFLGVGFVGAVVFLVGSWILRKQPKPA